MNRKVTILLLEDIQSLGKAGDIVTVNEGHARNFLFPQGLAALADKQTRSRAQAQQQMADAQSAKKLEEIQALAERLEGTELTVKARMKEADAKEIFGSITPQQIVTELNKEAGLALTPKDIKLTRAITYLGSEDVTVRLSPEVEIIIHVNIIPYEET